MSQITVLACTSAAGYAIPPFLIFKHKSWNPELAVGEISGSLHGVSENGWITRKLFDHWFSQHFFMHPPLLLLMDGHSTPETIEMAASHTVCIAPQIPPMLNSLLIVVFLL